MDDCVADVTLVSLHFCCQVYAMMNMDGRTWVFMELSESCARECRRCYVRWNTARKEVNDDAILALHTRIIRKRST